MSNTVAIDNRPRWFSIERFLTLSASILYLADSILENFGLYDRRRLPGKRETRVALTGNSAATAVGQVYPAIAAQIGNAETAARVILLVSVSLLSAVATFAGEPTPSPRPDSINLNSSRSNIYRARATVTPTPKSVTPTPTSPPDGKPSKEQ